MATIDGAVLEGGEGSRRQRGQGARYRGRFGAATHPTRAPSDEDVAEVVAGVWRKLAGKLGAYTPSAAARRFAEDAPVLRAIEDAAARGLVATGPRRGCRIVRVRGLPADTDACVLGRACAQVEGYNLQAATRVAANDRDARADVPVPGAPAHRERSLGPP